MMVILHITTRAQWETATAAGAYRGDTLDSEGFIHCATPRQVVGVANRVFAGRTGLVLLRIARGRVHAEIRDEAAPPGELFPHIYGPLNLDAVTGVLSFDPRADGTFALPDGLSVGN